MPEPSTTAIRSGKRSLIRAIVFGVACFLLIEAGVFRSGLFLQFTEPASYCGQVVAMLRNAKAFEQDSGTARRVLVLGDSRMGEGFSAKLCDELGQSDPRWFNASVPGSTPRVWSYMLDRLLRQGNRFDLVVLPLQSLTGRTSEFFMADRRLDGQFMPPILPLSCVREFSNSFNSKGLQREMLLRGFLRSYALQSDLLRLIEHPVRRKRDVDRMRKAYKSHYNYQGREESLAGKVGVVEGKVVFSPQIPETDHSLYTVMPDAPSAESLVKQPHYQRQWIGRIEKSCQTAGAKLVVLLAPRGPLGEIYDSEEGVDARDRLELSPKTVVLPAATFTALERPECYFDHLHMNALGRKEFSTILWKFVAGILDEEIVERGAR